MNLDEEHFIFKKKLADQLKAKDAEIQKWFQDRRNGIQMPIYSSVDLRDSGHKIAPVDSNLYPAGFNNICPEDMRATPKVFRERLKGVKKILLIPEFHTTNLYYLENVFYLRQLLTEAGIEVRIGWNPETPLGEPMRLKTATDKELFIENFTVVNGRAEMGDFIPDLILLNNDFSGGYPEILDSITEQPIRPSHKMGWHTRKKSEHFRHYNRLATELAEILGMDPWIFTIASTEVQPVNFDEGTGMEKIVAAADKILKENKEKHAQYGMDWDPFVFIKNNSGTYGMGIMVIHSTDEIKAMNRRTKNKMSTGKNKSQISSVVVQEGIRTTTLVDRLAAEPVIYLMECELIGGFLRTNTERGAEENLNSQGMVFRKLCMNDLRNEAEDDELEEEPVLERVYGTIARISALASGYEMKDRLRK
jgi:glutamate--cysteine ligase